MIISHPSFKKYQRKPLSLHLSNVAAGSKARIQRLSLYTQLISKDALADLAFRIGLLHDLGKASSFFQDYIHGGRKSPYTRHSLISAIILYYNLLEDERWKDFALIKVCLCSLGIMIGTGVPREGRKPVFIGALAAFLASWAAAMATFAPLLGDSFREED